MKFVKTLGALGGKAWRGAAFLAVFGVCAVTLTEFGAALKNTAAERVASSWGGEATAAVAEGVSKLSPIPLANACGMGASSCFKCHDGKRAPQPGFDRVKSPWHAQHAKVNNSCVGCHSGNPRIMKQDLAHKALVAKPFGGAQSCASCHTSDLNKVLGVYKPLSGVK
ncbi:hypothetical protein [Thermithiobacillus plumbiphilus]|uniref:Cytochrome c7-like domain-containing protein n=1 Tax=Thermithiobacillus plumbiphilus TaxID=1729899 RepID=A0ABU9D8J1_9PROT